MEDRQPALDGMVGTLDKYCSVKSVKKYLGSRKLRKANVEAVSEEVKNFEMSKDNVTRSVSLLYAGGLLSKWKYLQTRSALSTQCIGTKTEKGHMQRKRSKLESGMPFPRILVYKNLMQRANSIDIGKPFSVRETLRSNLPAEKRVDGVYRDLESMLLSLAGFYLPTDPFRKEGEKIRWFGAAKGNFKVALGGDGAPFGKWDESISWLVSFLNVGSRVASPNDNFLLFGVNCKETDEVVVKFAKQLKDQIAAIESKTYFIGDLPVTFSFELVPSDMKFLAFLRVTFCKIRE